MFEINLVIGPRNNSYHSFGNIFCQSSILSKFVDYCQVNVFHQRPNFRRALTETASILGVLLDEKSKSISSISLRVGGATSVQRLASVSFPKILLMRSRSLICYSEE